MDVRHHQNQAQNNKDTTHKNMKIVYYDYKVYDKVMLRNKAAHKYETPYTEQYEITQTWTNGMVIL